MAASYLPDFLVPDTIADDPAMNSTGNFYYSPHATPVLRKRYADCKRCRPQLLLALFHRYSLDAPYLRHLKYPFTYFFSSISRSGTPFARAYYVQEMHGYTEGNG